MRYNAFYGELPLEAFKPIGGRMRLYGGGDPISAVTNAVSDAVSSVGDVASSVASGVGDAVSNIASSDLGKAALVAAAVASANPELIPSITGGATALGDLGATDASLGAAGAVNAGVPVAVPVAPTALANLGATDASLGTAGATNAGGSNFLSGMGAENAVSGTGVAGTGILTNAPASSSSILSNLIPTTPVGQIVAAQGLTGLGSALIGADAAQKAANIQSAASQGATQLQGQIFNQINQQQAPYRTAGYNALNQLGSLGSGTYQMYDASGNPTTVGTGTGYLTHQFGPADLAAGLAPNYDFMLQQGQMANQRAANVGGGGLGGNALQGLQKFTQDYAGNAYQNAFTNYQNQRTNIYNTLAGIAGIGQQGQTSTNQAATNLANAQSQLGVGSAAAQAAGQIGTAGAYGNALGQLGSGLTLATLLNQRGNVTLPVA